MCFSLRIDMYRAIKTDEEQRKEDARVWYYQKEYGRPIDKN